MTQPRPEIPALMPDNLRTVLPAIEAWLARHGTLEISPLDNGIYPASSGQSPTAASGYQHAWIRDNVMVAHSRWALGDVGSAVRTITQVGKFLASQVPRMVDIISQPTRKEDVQRRPAVRFNARSLAEIDEPWAHAQNDALAYTMWLRLGLVEREGVGLDGFESEIYATLARYFGAIEYWNDRDSGAWEEGRKVNASSVGAVIAALAALKRCRVAGLIASAPPAADLDSWIHQGRQRLDHSLPFESPPERQEDAALLLLIEPLGLFAGRPIADAILSLVRARLMGPHGIRRYTGDSYFCQDYDRLFPPETRSGNFSEDMTVRDKWLRPGCEAQWCLFDPLLSAIFGRRFQRDRRRTDDLDLQLIHFNRALSQLTPDVQCVELYFLKGDTWTPNEHTPLAWTQANLAVALHVLKASAV